MQYLIAYDIENTKNRTKLFEKLKDFGLKPVQNRFFMASYQMLKN